MIELHQLRTFIAVANEVDLTKVAKSLGCTQQIVSSHIKSLSDELGVEFFLETPSGVEMTPEGASLKTQIQKILFEVDTLIYTARSLQDDIAGVGKIGFVSSSELCRTHKFSELLESQHAKVECQFFPAGTMEIIRDIQAGSFYGGYVYGGNHNPDDLEFLFLENHKLAIVGPKQWEKEIQSAEWSELAVFPWVWASQDCPCRNLIEDAFISKGLNLTATANSSDETTALSLIIAGAGLGVITETEALSVSEKVCIWNSESFSIDLSFAYQKNRLNDPFLLILLSCLKKVWELE